jgi:ribonuclease Z
MRPLLHPILVNGRFGDPALYVETLFEKRAILLDLGDIAALAPRKVNRIELVFVSHAHVDHFVGFDSLLRTLVGRKKTVRLFGPAGFIDRVSHKLQAYQWNLVDHFACDLCFDVAEVGENGICASTRFRLKAAFAKEPLEFRPLPPGIIHGEPAFTVSAAILEHRTPCLAFAVQEPLHVNVWKNRLAERGLEVGPWLRELKRAVIARMPDDYMIGLGQSQPGGRMPLGSLRSVLTVSPGQKIGYVTDAADTPANRKAIIDLVHGADVLFIEAPFAKADADLAAERAHLTTKAAGEIARDAGVKRVEPFHFSPRYEGAEEEMIAEVMEAFLGIHGCEVEPEKRGNIDPSQSGCPRSVARLTKRR